MTGKHGEIPVSTDMDLARQTYVDLNLPLSGRDSIIGRGIKLHVPDVNAPRACAEITEYVEHTGEATFDQDGVTGSVTFTQRSPYDPTITHVELRNLRSLAGGYDVHEWPVPQRVQADQKVCSPTSVSGHFNPFGVVYDGNTPSPGEGSDDMFEVS